MGKYVIIWLLLALDLVLIGLIFWFYLKIKRFLELPWDEFKESILRAEELVRTLERLGNPTQGPQSSSLPTEEAIALFKQGYSPRQIAKKLGISQGEVELLLKSKGFKIE
jgi:hypothetical protein